MKLLYKKILISLGIIIILSNTWLITHYLRLFIDENHFKYSNANGTMTLKQNILKNNYGSLKHRQAWCLIVQPELKDKQIYRLFPINPLAFWRWKFYLTDEKYKLPYKDWDEILKNREAILNNMTKKQLESCPRSF